MDPLHRIETLLAEIARGVARIADCLERPGREAAVAGDPMVSVADLDDLVARLRARFDMRRLVESVGPLSDALRELGYPVPVQPMDSYRIAWRNRALPRLVRDVSYRLYAETAGPDPTPEQVRLCVRALDGTFSDMGRVQQIVSPDDRTHHYGRPEDENWVTFWCWAWRRSRQLYDRKGAAAGAPAAPEVDLPEPGKKPRRRSGMKRQAARGRVSVRRR